MPNHNLYFATLNNGLPTSTEPREATYDPTRGAWVESGTGFVVKFVGLVEGHESIYSHPSKDEVLMWLRERT